MNAAESSDEQLAEWSAMGKEAAFEQLLARYHAHFYRLAYRILFSKEDAEELVQEAFIKLWTGKARFKDAYKTRFTTWFTQIVVNQCRDELRKRAKRQKADLKDVDLSEPPEQGLKLEAKEQERSVASALEHLPDRQRLAIVLFYYSELPQKEAAKQMGVSAKAFESLLSRGKTALKQNLGPELGQHYG